MEGGRGGARVRGERTARSREASIWGSWVNPISETSEAVIRSENSMQLFTACMWIRLNWEGGRGGGGGSTTWHREHMF